MKRDPRVLLHHVEIAGEDIEFLTDGRSLESYVGDRPTQLAIERCFITIREALNQIHRSAP